MLDCTNSDLNGYYNVFNNFREQGLQLTVYTHDELDKALCVWASMSRSSDDIMVIIADKNCSNNYNMFDDIAYKYAKYFKNEDYDSAVEYTMKVLKKIFPKHIKQTYNYKFNCNRNLSDLEEIIKDAKNLDYDDYYDLVTFQEDNYFCDLIIMEGKVGLRYSKYNDKNYDDFESLYFEEYKPDLTSPVTLMLGMKEKLNNFVDSEIDYEISIGI